MSNLALPWKDRRSKIHELKQRIIVEYGLPWKRLILDIESRQRDMAKSGKNHIHFDQLFENDGFLDLDEEILTPLKKHSTDLKMFMTEVAEEDLICGFEGIEWVKSKYYGTCFVVSMTGFKSRIRERSTIYLNNKLHQANVVPYDGGKKKYDSLRKSGVYGKRALLFCPLKSEMNVTKILVNRYTEEQLAINDFNDFCRKLVDESERKFELSRKWAGCLLSKNQPLPTIPEKTFNTTLTLYKDLNESQKYSVSKAFSSVAISSTQGPPGTGKTSTIAAIAKLSLEQGINVLCLSQTNAAARRMAQTMEKHFSTEELGIKISDEYFCEWHEEIYKPILRYKVQKFERPVMVSTIGSVRHSIHKLSEQYKYHRLVLDEASQVVDYDAIFLLRVLPSSFERIDMFSDRMQLSPYIAKSVEKPTSVIDRLLGKGENAPETNLLDIQYRMPYDLGELVSNLSYEGKLKHYKKFDGKSHIRFVSVDGIAQKRGKSMLNKKEASSAIRIYHELLKSCQTSDGAPDIVILSFYEAQRHEISIQDPSVQVFNVDEFQGQEASIVIITTATRKKVSSFLKDRNRVNVAISRAKDELIILGNEQTLRNTSLWSKILDASAFDDCTT